MKKSKLKVLLIAIIIAMTAGTALSQLDSVKFGLLETMKAGANYYNYSDKDKGAIEVIVWGGVKNPGMYLIPEGTSLMELISYTGGAADDRIFENFKFIRTKDKNPELKTDTVIVINYRDFFVYDKKKSDSLSKPNPTLLAGDLIVFPIKPEEDFWVIAQRVASVFIVPLLSIATLIVSIIRLSN
ncbi:MAG: SLBB domain-containing protein [Ignavibacteria bacterium]|nr:SLBB domain-containing protein [Ignavibacteria bacterium]